jgi:hypothetical protein
LFAFVPRCFGNLSEQVPGFGSAKMCDCRLEQISCQTLDGGGSRTSLFGTFGKQGGWIDRQPETITLIPSGVIRRRWRQQHFAGAE